MKTVAFGGQLACGKDTVADYLAKVLNREIPNKPVPFQDAVSDIWERVALASAVKKVFMDTFHVDMEFIEKWKRIDEAPPGFLKPVRQCLQFIGDGFRGIQDQIWIDLAFREEKNRIVSDMRYLNEIIKVKGIGGVTVLIWRPGFENNDPNGSEAQIRPLVDFFAELGCEGLVNPAIRAARCELPECADLIDVFLINEGTVEDLYTKVDNLIAPWVNHVYGD